ncbi:MAG: 3-dehydroquinate dehydratase [Flavobacteriales bacterium]|nr:3-dehydroquinate dehydratase [Flavobacteriales bacterium]MCX7649113.1 3-dehydroquinate dehydratase [Flavobacteriales bacterium]MDW8432031.1 type II 3-dehydroquinate dehydratase [Flavobacteriales bacterium]
MAKLKKIIIINGPNLHLQGKRQPEIYGRQTFDDLLKSCRNQFPALDIELIQSQHEGDLIDAVHSAGAAGVPVVLNAGAYAHTSYALADALAAWDIPVVEVHISNIFAREPWRSQSLTARYCQGVISGFGLEGYIMAIGWLLGHYEISSDTI